LPEWIHSLKEIVVMNTSDLLEQLLRASQGTVSQQSGGGASSQNPLGGLGGLLGSLMGG
jgi:hypothetical protein